MAIKSKFWITITFVSLILSSLAAFPLRQKLKKIYSELPDTNTIDFFHRPGTITLLSNNGTIIQKLGPTPREKIDFAEIPQIVKYAFIAIEDRRFFEHKGFDLRSISRAILTNVRERAVVEGASTITQQLARIVYLSQEQTYTRKIKEIALC